MFDRALLKTLVVGGALFGFQFSCVSLAPPPPGSLLLAWDPSADPSVVGYRLYQGNQSQMYDSLSDVSNATTASITGLVPGQTYYFAVTAYDSTGLESAFSGEISYTPPATAVMTPITQPNFSIVLGSINQAMIVGTAPPGTVYSILASQDLASWSVVGSVAADANGLLQYVDPVSPFSTTRFYRLVQAQPQPSTGDPAPTAAPASISSLLNTR